MMCNDNVNEEIMLWISEWAHFLIKLWPRGNNGPFPPHPSASSPARTTIASGAHASSTAHQPFSALVEAVIEVVACPAASVRPLHALPAVVRLAKHNS